MSRPLIRDRLLAKGKCPSCAGAEDLIPGLQYGPACRAKQCELQRKRRARLALTTPPPPDASVWDIPLDGLALALAQAEADLADAV